MTEIETRLRPVQQQAAALTQQFRSELKELQDSERAAERHLARGTGDAPTVYAVVAERVSRGELSWYDVISGRTSDPDASELHESLWHRLDAVERGDVTLFEETDAEPAAAAIAPEPPGGDTDDYSRFVIGGRR